MPAISASEVSAWCEGRTLVVSKRAILPPYCVKCGQPASGHLSKWTFSWRPSWMYLFLLLGLLLGAIIIAVASKRVTLRLPLCVSHRKTYNAYWFAGFFLLVGFVPTSITAAIYYPDYALVCLTISMLAVVAALICLSLYREILKPVRIDKQFARFSKAGELFLNMLPQFAEEPVHISRFGHDRFPNDNSNADERARIEHRRNIGTFVKVTATMTVSLWLYMGLAERPFSFLFLNQSIDQTVIKQSVVNVLCSSAYAGKDRGGSGTIITTDGTVITNSHVIPQDERQLLTTQDGCLVVLPNSQNGQPEEIYWAKPVVFPGVSDKYDLAYLNIYDVYVDEQGEKHGSFPRTFQSIFSDKERYDEVCRLTKPRLGDPMRIYGYPQTSGGFNLTITDGIVSSVASEGVILTSAKIDEGNSGGLAVDGRGCMVGIPTAVTQGKYQNLGVITATSRVLEFSDAVDKLSKSR